MDNDDIRDESAETVTESENSSVAPTAAGTLVEQELLVEEISIDGMCGVY